MLRAIEWIVLGLGSAAAIVYGVRRHRPARIGPWLLLAGAIVASTAGDVLTALDRPGGAEICFYAMFVLVAGSLLQLTRAGAILVDRARLIDLLAFACSTLLVVWVFVIGDAGQIGNISGAYVIGALLLLAVVARVLVAVGRNVSAALLVIGAVGVLVSDIVQPLWPGRLSESGFVLFYLAWGAAALHPSMVRLTEPAARALGGAAGHLGGHPAGRAADRGGGRHGRRRRGDRRGRCDHPPADHHPADRLGDPERPGPDA